MGENAKEIKELTVIEDPVEAKEDIKPIAPRGRGRPPGAKNKDTLFKELMTSKFQDLATTEVEKAIEVLFKKAHDGDMKAIKLILDRVVPVTKAVDLADMEKKGLTVNISIGNLEDSGQVIEDVEYAEVIED